MAQQNKADFKTTKNTQYAANTSQDITSATHRTVHENVADSAVFLDDEWTLAKKGPAPVRVALTANVDLDTEVENGDTQDGVTLETGDRFLAPSQTDPGENGIYIVQASGAAIRSDDFRRGDQESVFLGSEVYVQEGTTNAKKTFTLTDRTNFVLAAELGDLTFKELGVSSTGERTSSATITITKKNTVFTGSSATTVTLPTPSDIITWKHHYFVNDGTANASFSGESFIAYPGTRYTFFHDGTNWIFIG